MKNIRARFAPSPTGALHLGGLRTALYNYIIARKHNGKFILRIEDTDKDRLVVGAEKYIEEALEWCGLSTDESPKIGGKYGPYRQSDRKYLYDFYIQKLLEKGHAYYAFDTASTVEEKRKQMKKKGKTFTYNAKTRLQMNNSLSRDTKMVFPYVIRFKTPNDKLISVYDKIRGPIKINTSSLDDKILVKSDGRTTYHLAHVVDDHLMKITHVIRGEEWLSSIPLHILIYGAFEWEIPLFAHLPLILKTNGGGKLSKRYGGDPIFPLEWKDTKTISTGYREEGYFPEAIVNMLALLGWSPGKGKELFCLNKLEKKFSLLRVQKSGAIFNKEKASWFNKQIFQRKPLEHLMIIFRREFHKHGAYTNDKELIKVIKTVKNRVSLVQELWNNSYYFFIAPQTNDNKYITKIWGIDSFSILNTLQNSLMKEEDFRSSNLRKFIKFFVLDYQLELKLILQTLRLALVGTLKGGDIFLIMEILGKKETIERIKFLKVMN